MIDTRTRPAVRVRPAEGYDLHRLREIGEAARLTPDTDPAFGFLRNPKAEDLDGWWAGRASLKVAELDGTIVGYALLWRMADLTRPACVARTQWLGFDAPPEWTIDQLVVIPSARRRGAASALYKAVLSETDGAFAVCIIHEPYNAASVAFHRAHGFEPVYDMPGNQRFGWLPYGLYYNRNAKASAA